jgi:hypothetical protein
MLRIVQLWACQFFRFLTSYFGLLITKIARLFAISFSCAEKNQHKKKDAASILHAKS